ncbi:hypothetical protein [Candidatus Contendibacter odensensis]|uniref:hypothetical protein n=1 Tax=Candidatus Contendibacter odensensis TaxID=1400860 RepID=UPI00054DB2BB|nr:hypothetical protein [Candidatus Contendobacter odensis]
MHKEQLIGKLFRFKIEQAGGKYGSFICAVCGSSNAYYKFSAGSGGCDTCGASYIRVEGVDLTVADKGKFGPHWMTLQLESFSEPVTSIA